MCRDPNQVALGVRPTTGIIVILYEFGKDTESHLNTDYDTNAIHTPYVGNGGR